MKPVIALVGRPNVGKSTLFNRLTKSRDALVADFAGLTRDRKYGEATINDVECIIVDTGGISGAEDEGIDRHMAEQSRLAIEEADLVALLVDARAGLTPADEELARQLRERSKPVCVILNKIDGVNEDVVTGEFYRLGLGDPLPISASHGRNITLMLEALSDLLPEPEDDFAAELPEEVQQGIKIAVIGRPNVGKSTLVNRMLGEDRVVVFDMPGTTRDSIYIPYERHGSHYTLIDTAGVRRRGKVQETVEKFSVIKTLQAMDDANVVVMVFDAREGIVDQDLHLLGYALESGRAMVIAVNKWDGMDESSKRRVKEALQRRLQFVDYVKIHFISALHGTGVGHLYESVEKAYKSAMIKANTNYLTKILEDAVSEHNPPLVRGRRIKLRYAHMGGSNPPLIVIHGNQTESVPGAYKRYLENIYRKTLKLEGTPLKIDFKTGDNPFAGRRNKLTPRQISKKRRMMKHVKKK